MELLCTIVLLVYGVSANGVCHHLLHVWINSSYFHKVEYYCHDQFLSCCFEKKPTCLDNLYYKSPQGFTVRISALHKCAFTSVSTSIEAASAMASAFS